VGLTGVDGQRDALEDLLVLVVGLDRDVEVLDLEAAA
jgi:hypothetical protein